MRAIRVAPVALLGGAALVPTAPAASACAGAPGGAPPATGITVTPSVITPGSQVVLAARGCPTTAIAGSGVLDTVTVPRGGSVAATVDQDARAGVSHEVTFGRGTSPGSVVQAGLAVAAAPNASAAGPATAPAGVRGEAGGTAGTTEIAAWTAPAVVAATAVHLARRHRESRSH
ncbi:hypothetical protein ACFVFH_22940 [Streptomyces sp. NPDC057697]|uniref:hypothetical protein n=1 Tax=Streptomyces sp. NPDC057697 TaxID=3346219 RepID=UPI0036B7F07B